MNTGLAERETKAASLLTKDHFFTTFEHQL